MSLTKLKPEHLAIIKAIDSMEELVKETKRRIAELKATLPVQKTKKPEKGKRSIMNPLTGKKEYY
ncbi:MULTISPECIES: hypothetical protein [Desulfobacula]|uniref:Uncharacterized protein n=2 Tax=Desulfobacula TaxID=28222 RepID=K0NMG5_DESTT|nr:MULTISPECIES: hypothetical protein [Desulfobacula]CCK81228.1 uncharacterized protein TOL2_C30710 [Desulfobacula toluolica Tol2]SDU38790.1 hypothetical protein SAMN04487931_107220 [Desulfobacula phenolica]